MKSAQPQALRISSDFNVHRVFEEIREVPAKAWLDLERAGTVSRIHSGYTPFLDKASVVAVNIV